MAKTINIDNNKDEIIKTLQKAVQSANLNFLIGSGCSYPAIPILGNIEQDIQNFIDAEENVRAEQKIIEYLVPFIISTKHIQKKALDDNHKQTLETYHNFLQAISKILFLRKSNILHKQATVFSTNYDLFIEKAGESFDETLIINDGFNRSPALKNAYKFSPNTFFHSVFNTGNLYKYQVQIPTINLIKLHGSLNWEISDKKIYNSLKHIDKAEKLMKFDEHEKKAKLIELFTLILPKKDKFKETILNQVYYDLLRIYSNELDKENTLLITEGFSFADEHILEITKRALVNPTLRLIAFCFKADELSEYKNNFKTFNNVDIIYSDKELITFDLFNSILIDLLPKKEEAPIYQVNIKEPTSE